MSFVGREHELALLERQHAGPGGAFVPIYGRRRIGKSELILRFLEHHPGLYHVGKQAPAGLQIREFLDEAARLLSEPLLAALPALDWRTAIEHVEQRWKSPRKLVLAFDEFQWTAEGSPELPSVLQELWDRKWKRSGKVMLILCGSFIGFMEREVLGARSPLFGRRTAQIQLQPFDFAQSCLLHRGWSLQQQAETYFVLGGVPQYLNTFRTDSSLQQNVETQLLHEFAPLFCEPEFLLREELRDVQSYHAVLLAIAAGAGATKDIALRSGLPERSLHYYLEQLVQLGYVARRLPLTGAKPSRWHVRFSLEDPLLRFYFRFVFPHRGFVQRYGGKRSWRELVAPGLDSYFGGCFERLCRQALPALWAREGVSSGGEVGEYWDKKVQIDLVGVREDGWIDLGECKWGAPGSPATLEGELERKVAGYPNPKNRTLGRRVFVRQLPARLKLAGVKVHDLRELHDAISDRARS